MKYFRVIIAVNDETTLDDMKELVSHYDGQTEFEVGDDNVPEGHPEGLKIVVPNVEEVSEFTK